MPPVLAFYELALRVYFPLLPSLFAIAVNLCQRGILTADTIIWLASSLPTNFLGGLGAVGGVAMQTTAAMVGVAASSGNALVGTATGFVGNASKTVAQGINHLKPGVVATDITHVISDGSRIAADHATSITSLVKNGETAVIENVSHLISSDRAISPGHLVPDIAKNAVHTVVDNTSAITDSAVGATKAAVTENATKLAHVLDSANPLHLHIMPSESQDARVCVIISCIQSCHVSNS
jgi:methionine aminopeptidase